ncbi:MAG: 5-formyltetrahydrofolate cyclo-ligase [Gammaproteobacteria bacterium]
MRQRIRAARRDMSPAARAAADRAISRHILSLPEFRSAQRIALFLAFDGEPSMQTVIAGAAARGKRVYAPVLTSGLMHFAELDTVAALTTNFFGILEPRVGSRIDARRLDLVLTPLVAFDDRGVRVGVGRGYYDRCFRFLLNRDHWRHPKLVGVAYELQRAPNLVRQSWDVPLAGAVTETGIRRFGDVRP